MLSSLYGHIRNKPKSYSWLCNTYWNFHIYTHTHTHTHTHTSTFHPGPENCRTDRKAIKISAVLVCRDVLVAWLLFLLEPTGLFCFTKSDPSSLISSLCHPAIGIEVVQVVYSPTNFPINYRCIYWYLYNACLVLRSSTVFTHPNNVWWSKYYEASHCVFFSNVLSRPVSYVQIFHSGLCSQIILSLYALMARERVSLVGGKLMTLSWLWEEKIVGTWIAFFREIWSSHYSNCENCCLVVCEDVLSTFQRNCGLHYWSRHGSNLGASNMQPAWDF